MKTALKIKKTIEPVLFFRNYHDWMDWIQYQRSCTSMKVIALEKDEIRLKQEAALIYEAKKILLNSTNKVK